VSTSKPNFGARTARVEDPALLTGKGRFVDDIALPGTLSAVFVRSPHAHAAINRVDASAARAMPGVRAVFTLDDLMPHLSSERTPLGQSVREIVGLASRSLRENITPFVLVRDEACYVGDPIAVVIANSRPVAEDAAQRVTIEFEPLPAVADIAAAIAPDAPSVHRRVAGNILAEYTIAYGDCEHAFAAAAHRVSLSLFQHRGCAHLSLLKFPQA
jgi:aerobic carbon-monoxide dehydrogenase large subunit